jgi:hypothetical protein
MGQPVSQISCDILTDYLTPNTIKHLIVLAVWLKGAPKHHSSKSNTQNFVFNDLLVDASGVASGTGSTE